VTRTARGPRGVSYHSILVVLHHPLLSTVQLCGISIRNAVVVRPLLLVLFRFACVSGFREPSAAPPRFLANGLAVKKHVLGIWCGNSHPVAHSARRKAVVGPDPELDYRRWSHRHHAVQCLQECVDISRGPGVARPGEVWHHHHNEREHIGVVVWRSMGVRCPWSCGCFCGGGGGGGSWS
jgi:hypothetical protein